MILLRVSYVLVLSSMILQYSVPRTQNHAHTGPHVTISTNATFCFHCNEHTRMTLHQCQQSVQNWKYAIFEPEACEQPTRSVVQKVHDTAVLHLYLYRFAKATINTCTRTEVFWDAGLNSQPAAVDNPKPMHHQSQQHSCCKRRELEKNYASCETSATI